MNQMLSVRARLIAGVLLSLPGQVHAQPAPRPVGAPQGGDARAGGMARNRLEGTIVLLEAHLTLRDAIALVEQAGRVRIRAVWADETHPDGLRPEAPIDLEPVRAPLFRVVEAILRQTDSRAGGGATWQVGEDGAIEIGPRSCLNERRTMRIYDVRDLLSTLPDFTRGATLDLAAALQARAGGGSVMRDDDGPMDMGADARPDRGRELIEAITQTIEPEQWADNGGTGATIRLFQNQLIVVAPAYIHRQVVGANSRGTSSL